MDDTTVNLLGLYAGLVLMNTLISSFMYWNSRQALHRDLLAIWACMMLAFVAQGATGALFPDHHLVIVLGFSTLWFANLGFARLITRILDMQMPWRASGVAFLVGLVGAITAFAAGAHFTLVALPVAVGISYPTFVSASLALRYRWHDLSITGRALMFACFAISLHQLDYPFLRHIEEYTAMGFTIAILVVFALSIFAPAVILEIVTSHTARVSAEMEVAHRIQMKVLPTDPHIPGLELTGYMKPAEEVGGDYYDVYTLGDHSWILLGDVTGHGLSSGLVMLMAQSIMASILHTRQEISPAELNFLANKVLHQNLRRLDELRSMTIVALCRVGDEQRFTYSGNHDHVYIYRAASGEVESIDVTGVPHDLGFMSEFPLSEFTQSTFTLEEGDLVFITTDGVTEAARHGLYRDGMFDSERVVQLLKQVADRPLPDIKSRILEELDRFTDGIYHDDVTFLLARPLPTAAA